MPAKINDGLTKSQRYRLKDLAGYRKRKAAYARTPEERRKRTEYMRAWREKNRDRHNRLARESHQRNKHKHVDKQRENVLIRSFNMTLADYSAFLENQRGVCAICGQHKVAQKKQRMHVDHCHETGVVRGILCHVCNTHLGWFEKYLQSINAYLKDPPAKRFNKRSNICPR